MSSNVLEDLYEEQFIKYYDEMYTLGDRVRLIEAKTAGIAPSLMRRKGTVVSIDFSWSHTEDVMTYWVIMDNRKKAIRLYHDELELLE